MNAILDLYELPYDPCEPIVGLDEKSKQLLSHLRMPIPLTAKHGVREDSEYIRKGTCNLFVAVEPKGNKRYVKVTPRRTKKDFAYLVKELVENEYDQSKKLHLKDILRREVTVWADDRNKRKKGIEWSFTKEKAAVKFKINAQQN